MVMEVLADGAIAQTFIFVNTAACQSVKVLHCDAPQATVAIPAATRFIVSHGPHQAASCVRGRHCRKVESKLLALICRAQSHTMLMMTMTIVADADDDADDDDGDGADVNCAHMKRFDAFFLAAAAQPPPGKC
jgi:hypothetical protein